MRYGRIRPLGSCGRRVDAVVLPPGPGPAGVLPPPAARRSLPDGQVKGTLQVSLRDRCATLTCPSARRTGSYRVHGGTLAGDRGQQHPVTGPQAAAAAQDGGNREAGAGWRGDHAARVTPGDHDTRL
jgi:hypothetical protein